MKTWLTQGTTDSTRIFDVIKYTENSNWEKNTIVDKLKILLEENTVDKDLLDDLFSNVNWDKDKIYKSFVTNSQPISDTLRKGKFGEILHGEILSSFHDLNILMKKHQYQITPGTSLHGTDIIAFKINEENVIQAFFYIETKLRTSKDYIALTEAFIELQNALNESVPSYLKFILKELKKTNSVFYHAVLDYGIQITPKDNFRIGAIFESSAWTDTYLKNLLDVYDKSIPNLTVDVIMIDSLNKLVNDTYQKLGADIV